MTDHHRKTFSLIFILVFLLFCIVVGWYIGIPMVRLASDPQAFRLWVDKFGIWSKVVFIAMVTFQVLIALIPGEPLEFAAGYAFGAVEGTILSMAGIIIGSWLVFLLVRYFGVKLLSVFFSDRDIRSLHFLKDTRKINIIVFLLMVLPGTPKDLLSYFAGLTKLTTAQWLMIVAVARIPSLVTSTVTGAAAGEQNYILAAVMAVITLLLSAAGLLYYRRICRQQNVLSSTKKMNSTNKEIDPTT